MYPIKPTNTDIICGQDKKLANHPGNQTFRNKIVEYASEYGNATKPDKMRLTHKIVTSLQNEHNSRFICFNRESFAWEIISDQRARDKASHALRFAHQTIQRTVTARHESNRMNRIAKAKAIQKTKIVSTAAALIYNPHKPLETLLPQTVSSDISNESIDSVEIDRSIATTTTATTTKQISARIRAETEILYQRQQVILKNLRLSDCDNATSNTSNVTEASETNEANETITPEILEPLPYDNQKLHVSSSVTKKVEATSLEVLEPLPYEDQTLHATWNVTKEHDGTATTTELLEPLPYDDQKMHAMWSITEEDDTTTPDELESLLYDNQDLLFNWDDTSITIDPLQFLPSFHDSGTEKMQSHRILDSLLESVESVDHLAGQSTRSDSPRTSEHHSQSTLFSPFASRSPDGSQKVNITTVDSCATINHTNNPKLDDDNPMDPDECTDDDDDDDDVDEIAFQLLSCLLLEQEIDMNRFDDINNNNEQNKKQKQRGIFLQFLVKRRRRMRIRDGIFFRVFIIIIS